MGAPADNIRMDNPNRTSNIIEVDGVQVDNTSMAKPSIRQCLPEQRNIANCAGGRSSRDDTQGESCDHVVRPATMDCRDLAMVTDSHSQQLTHTSSTLSGSEVCFGHFRTSTGSDT